MRRIIGVWVVAAGLVASACGATELGGQDVATDSGSGPARPSVLSSGPYAGALGSQTPLPRRRLGGLGGFGGVEPSVRRVGPVLQPSPPLPAPSGPAMPGDEPSAQPNVFQATLLPTLSPAVADVPTRVYVPNSDAHTVSVIDPATLEVIDRFPVGRVPHHVTPSWDLTKLYVNNTSGNSFSVIDPRSGRVTETLPVVDPYNLYFTPDGTKAIVVAERLQRLDYRNPQTWELIKSVSVPWAGVDHLDFSADGRYLLASCEFTGQVVKVDNETMEVVGRANVGSLPIDVKVAPDGSVFFVANQGRHGVSVIDPERMSEIAFLPTGTGAHGLNYSRDTTRLFVSNRLAGSVSVIDVASREVVATWKVGGSPDMLQVTPDGTQLWASNRYHGSVSVIDSSDGHVIKTIPTGAGAHGVSFFPQPGRFNVGHNGVYR
ncbi:MAG: cytochrome D1 domain-containing protein [Acidimicrobiales bacterium]